MVLVLAVAAVTGVFVAARSVHRGAKKRRARKQAKRLAASVNAASADSRKHTTSNKGAPVDTVLIAQETIHNTSRRPAPGAVEPGDNSSSRADLPERMCSFLSSLVPLNPIPSNSRIRTSIYNR
ncbi:hypothetical protein BC834DRAFT_302230 [Gloeopeniophorella convolvens]|nr:hypothetical protein BC834DRAFT_302230 [Gloeopeniophorella convolvens]